MRAGIIINNFKANQIGNTILQEISKIKKQEYHSDIICFCEKRSFASISGNKDITFLHQGHLWGYNGTCIANDLDTCLTMINCSSIKNKYFYLWDLEWMGQNYDLDYLCSIYLNPLVKLIARSEEHAQIIESCWKKPVATIEDFNYEEITKIINE